MFLVFFIRLAKPCQHIRFFLEDEKHRVHYKEDAGLIAYAAGIEKKGLTGQHHQHAGYHRVAAIPRAHELQAFVWVASKGKSALCKLPEKIGGA